ncbi:MAG: porin [Eudoraea sp.]|uniref:OprO/OprP family phosphate-selective porin n=1 Tax=Eudoraea sp. TaxID=1979955 RepID=UPI003C70E488
MIRPKFLFITMLMMLPFFGITQDAIIDLENILIRNVTVIDQERKSEDVVVSILIKQGKLNLVTKDQIALSKDDIAFDATGGFIFGELEVGKPAGFIILDQDPRINVDIILDTKSYAIFAVSKGKVILNTMVRIDDDDMQGQLSGWESYTSPPLALPLSYQNNRKWNVFRTKPVTAVLGGAILMENTRWFSDDPVNEQQVGDLSEFKGGSVRGFRAGLGGTFNFKKPWSYLFTFGTRAFERGFSEDDLSEFVLYDYRVDIPLGSASLSVGKTRETISISRLSSLIYLPSQQERASVADGLLPSRNIGITINNNFAKERMTWAAGVFNNWFETNRSISDNPTVFTGRITALPYQSEDESNLVHLGIAGRYSNAAAGIRYKSKTEIFSGPVSVDTDLIDDAESTFHYGLELALRKGPFILVSEFIQSNVRSSTFNDPVFKGYYIVASYTITGEIRSYNKRGGVFNKVKVANGINTGGWGELEVYSRWSSVDMTDQSIDGGEMNTFSAGINWYPISAIQVNINYRYSTLDRFGDVGYNSGLVSRLVFILE